MIDPLASSDWGWSNVVALVETRDQAIATIGLFSGLREAIGWPVEWWTSVSNSLPPLTGEDWARIQAHDFPNGSRVEPTLRALKPIALDPAKQADALLALDVHMAYLRATFDIAESESES